MEDRERKLEGKERGRERKIEWEREEDMRRERKSMEMRES